MICNLATLPRRIPVRRDGAAVLAASACALLPILGPSVAEAQPSGSSPAPSGPAADPGPQPNTPPAATPLDTSGDALGDVWGARPWLSDRGLSFGLSEVDEVFGNTTGGIHRGAAYDGLTQFGVGLDLERAFGIRGGVLNVSGLQIHGRDLSQDNLGLLDTLTGIEADRATRLWELWYDQFTPNGGADIKIGLQSLDQEFMLSPSLSAFANASFGWPGLPSVDLYAGGPSYPLSSLGVRLRLQHGAWTALAAVTDDNPGGEPFEDDPQPASGAAGLLHGLRTGALVIAELAYAVGQSAPPPSSGSGGAPTPEPGQIPLAATQNSGLPGVYKLGAWFDTASFPDPATSSVVGPTVSDTPDIVRRRHDFSAYLVADQTVWRPRPSSARALSLFLRIMGAPGDRNPVTFSGNAGAVLKDPLPNRDDDTFGIAVGVTKLGRQAVEFSRLAAASGANGYVPIQSAETYLEVSYQYVPRPWLIVQPDLQYVFLPGAGLANPSRPDRRISNELVLGTRVAVVF
ncbi:MAG: carbohydrate porin [Gluconacetobacter diazotrophicus]|nr:carbohydrate porin [Gluconacetobacter diazotrophicus]